MPSDRQPSARVPRLLVTGEPGSGKSAVLDGLHRHFGARILVLPALSAEVREWGMPPLPGIVDLCKQYDAALLDLQYAAEGLADVYARATGAKVVVLERSASCADEDVGTAPEPSEEIAKEFARYDVVVFLAANVRGNPSTMAEVQTESFAFSANHARLVAKWQGHKNLHIIGGTNNNLGQVERVVQIVEELMAMV